MEFTKKQIDAMRESYRRRLVVWFGSVRSGKTHAQIFFWNHFLKYGPRGQKVIAGKTLETLRENILKPAMEIFPGEISYTDKGKQIRWGKESIRGIGANNELAAKILQGSTLAGIMGDEVAEWPESFFKMALTRLSVRGAQFLGTCNPDSPFHWLKKDYIDKKDELGLDLAAIRFHIDDNTTLDPIYKENLKKEFSGGVWQKRYIEGLWVLADGLVYDMFKKDRHVVKGQLPQFNNYIVGIDYGVFKSATTYGLFGFDSPDKIYLVKEYYYSGEDERKQKTTLEYANDFKDFIRGYQDRLQAVYIDPSAAALKVEMSRIGGIPLKNAKNERLPGIQFVSNKLQKDELLIHESCKHSISEFETYVWDKSAQKRGIDEPLKKNDHTMDLIRYALYTRFFSKYQRGSIERY